MYFVSGDSDYVSPLDDSEINEYLADEWESKKKSGVIFFRRISEFFKDSFPAIHLASEVEKDDLIQKLSKSPSFTHTHVLVAKLAKFDEFSPEHVEQLVAAAETNSQVEWILDDDDVKAFYANLLKTSAKKLGKEALNKLASIVDKQDQG